MKKTKDQRCLLVFLSRRPPNLHSPHQVILPVHPSWSQLYQWYLICNKCNHALANISLLLESLSQRTISVIFVDRSIGRIDPRWYFLSTFWFPRWTNQLNKLADRMEPPPGSFLSVSVSGTDAPIDLFLTVQIWEQEPESSEWSPLYALSPHHWPIP